MVAPLPKPFAILCELAKSRGQLLGLAWAEIDPETSLGDSTSQRTFVVRYRNYWTAMSERD